MCLVAHRDRSTHPTTSGSVTPIDVASLHQRHCGNSEVVIVAMTVIIGCCGVLSLGPPDHRPFEYQYIKSSKVASPDPTSPFHHTLTITFTNHQISCHVY